VPPRGPSKIFETRTESWHQAGLLRQLNRQLSPAVVRRARLEAPLLVALFVAVVLAYDHRLSWFGLDTPVRVVTVLALLALGWAIARDVGRALGPALFRRMDPATAGTAGFVVRLTLAGVALVVALRTAGIDPRTLAVGGAFTAVIFGLGAQQTLGNVIAGTVLLSARPFRVGERVRLQAGAIGGQVEGVVSSLGLLYTTFATGEDLTMVPNSQVLNAAVMPLREPESVDLRARLRPGVTPGDLQRLLEASLSTPIRNAPRITLEELDGEEVIVRIAATPQLAADGPDLATELLAIVSRETRAPDGGREAANGGRKPVPDGSSGQGTPGTSLGGDGPQEPRDGRHPPPPP